MKSATFLTPPSTGLSGTQFSILNVWESLIPKDQKICDEVGATFYGRHTALYTRCCEYKISGEKSIPWEQPNQTKIKNENCIPGFIESVNERHSFSLEMLILVLIYRSYYNSLLVCVSSFKINLFCIKRGYRLAKTMF